MRLIEALYVTLLGVLLGLALKACVAAAELIEAVFR